MKQEYGNLWLDYKSEVIFGLILSLVLVLSAWMSHWIPVDFFDLFLNPALSVCNAGICFLGASLCLKHSEGILMRKSWGAMLVGWGVWEIAMLIVSATLESSIMLVGTDTLSSITMDVACVFAWLLFIYPTEVLRPGWLNWRRGLLQLVPLALLGLLDYYVPADLRWLIVLYPIGLLALLLEHIRRYRQWSEENFSTLDDIDVQWIVRYLIMIVLSGAVFYWLCISDSPTRAFTQQWYLMFILMYTTERVLYRPDPWKRLRSTSAEATNGDSLQEQQYAAYKEMFETWMESEKPYLNPDFQLMDLRQILPINRTYLSQFINSQYGCTFYHLVNRFRIGEARRLMTEKPELKFKDIALLCGFSSATTFTRAFLRETGVSPSEWNDNPSNDQ